MKKLLCIMVLSFVVFNVNAITLDYYLITSFCEKVDKQGNKTYSCVQGGKTYELNFDEYTTLMSGGMIEK